MNYGPAIKRIRNSKGLKSQFVAKQIGLTPGHYCGIENRGYNLSMKRLEQIATVLGVGVDYILKESKKAS